MPEPTVTITYDLPAESTGSIEFRKTPTEYSPDEHVDSVNPSYVGPDATWATLASMDEDGVVALPANSVLQVRFSLGGANPILPGFPHCPVSSMTWIDFRVPNTGPRKLLDLIAAYNVHPTPSHLADIIPTSTLFNPAA